MGYTSSIGATTLHAFVHRIYSSEITRRTWLTLKPRVGSLTGAHIHVLALLLNKSKRFVPDTMLARRRRRLLPSMGSTRPISHGCALDSGELDPILANLSRLRYSGGWEVTRMPEPLVTPTKDQWEQAIAEVDAELLDAFPLPSMHERRALVEERAHRLAAANPPPTAVSRPTDLVTLGDAMADVLEVVTSAVIRDRQMAFEWSCEGREAVRAWRAEIRARQAKAVA